LNRIRRQIQPFQPFGFPNFPSIPVGQGTGSFVSTSQVTSLDNRFGADSDPVVTGQSTFITQNKDGKVQQSTTYLRPDGSTYTQSNNSKFTFIVHFFMGILLLHERNNLKRR
jgi:hypothetical protein